MRISDFVQNNKIARIKQKDKIHHQNIKVFFGENKDKTTRLKLQTKGSNIF